MNKKEEATKKTEIMLQRVIDLLPTRIFWKNNNSVFLGCNKILAKDAGKENPEEIIGKTDFELSWGKQADIYRKDDADVMASGKEKLNFEEPQTTPNGDLIWLRTSKVPLVDFDGKIIGVIGIYDDITEQKKAEEELLKKTAELENFNKIFIDRELKMIELKEKLKELEKKLNQKE
jgi:PAS domain S-box-containing protein